MKKALLLFLIIIVSFSFICFTCLDVKAADDDCFTGCIGSPNDCMLYNATNTFRYNGYNTNGDSDYVHYDMSTSNNNPIKTGSPQITVLTHGLNGDASHWSSVLFDTACRQLISPRADKEQCGHK